MERMLYFLKSTKRVSRILFFLWIIFSAFAKFPNETRLQIVIEFSALFLVPAAIVEVIKNPAIRNHGQTDCSESRNVFWAMCKHLSAGSLVLIFFWVFFLVFMSIDMRAEILGIGGIEFAIFSYFSISLFFFVPVILIESKKNPILIEWKKNQPNASDKAERYISGSKIAAMFFGILSLAGGIVTLTGSSDIRESLPPTILFSVVTVILSILSINAPKTKTEAEERKKAKIALQEARRKQAEYEKRMKAYRGIFLNEHQIRQLENRIELPVVDTPVFLGSGELAVYHSVATRQETKNRVVGRTGGYSGGTVRIAKGFSIHTGSSSSRPIYGDVSTHYEGELILTNKRLVFLSEQKGFEVPYNAITAATSYADGLSIQSRSHTYTLLLPKANLATIAFDAVRTSELPIAQTVDYEMDEYDYNECDEVAANDISLIDGMEGHEFEYFCAELLKKDGFSDVSVTKGSGDQGVDILAMKGGVKYAIQCKNYSSPLGNTPVQEVSAGKLFYNCHVGVVMTNSTFTSGAKALAQATGVLLWDRTTLQKMMDI